jgi:hypothetical protein
LPIEAVVAGKIKASFGFTIHYEAAIRHQFPSKILRIYLVAHRADDGSTMIGEEFYEHLSSIQGHRKIEPLVVFLFLGGHEIPFPYQSVLAGLFIGIFTARNYETEEAKLPKIKNFIHCVFVL